MYRELEKCSQIKDLPGEIVKTMVDDVSGSRIHIVKADGYYEVKLETGDNPKVYICISKITAEIFRALKSLPFPK